MLAIRSLFVVSFFAASGLAMAAAPTLKVSKSVTIDASADAVWAKARDFGGLNQWHPAVAKDEIVAGKDNEPGAERLLTLGDGGTIKEKLLGFDNAHHTFKYAILEGVLPVSDYTSVFVIKSAGKGKSTVTWSGDFKRKNIGANPGAKEDDATAKTTIAGVYQAGLDNLKKMIEAK